MGDFLAPKRRDVVDRLRRRIEQYRHRHINCLGRFNVNRLSVHEQQKHETELLHQRWLENKAKKAKQSKVKDSGGGGGGGGGGGNSNSQSDHRNLVTKLKQKIDATTTNNDNTTSAASDNIFKFDDTDHQGSGGGGQSGSGVTSHVSGGSNVSSSTNVGVSGRGQDGGLPRLSVQIVQQISSQRQSPQTIHTNVTVSSTRYPPPSANHPAQPDSSPSQPGSGSNINVHTSTSTQQHPHGLSGVTANTTTTATVGNNNNNNNNPASRSRESSVPGCSSASVSTETSVHTSIECKQEPLEDVQCEVSHVLGDPVSTPSSAPVPDLPYDEIQFFLESIEKDGDDLIKELDDFDKIYHKVQTRAESSGADSSGSVFPPLDGCDSPGLSKVTAHFTDPSQVPSQLPPSGPPPPALTPTMFEPPQTMGGMGPGTGMVGRQPPALVEATGPAAETLKQMAAQHQQTAGPPYPGKGLPDSHFPDPYDPFGRARNGYPAGYPGQGYAGSGGYPGYTQNAGYGDGTPPMGPYSGGKPDLGAIGFGQTKPLTHYPSEGHGMAAPPGSHGTQGGGPSSLQQLQNQVASHFSPMHITQTQHVHLPQGHRHIHLSQTQQVQMAAAAAAQQQQQQQQQQQLQQQGVPQGMTVSQQQSFSMGPHMQGQGQTGQGQAPQSMAMSSQMHMMQEKMRREQQQQYMNRPPPEYKLHTSARPPGPPYQAPGAAGVHSNGSSTPLQTMQNMVNQTPPYPTTIKGEAGTGSAGVMTQMSAVQSMAVSVNTTGPHMASSMAQASQSMAFQQQQQQQQSQAPAVPQRPPSYSPNTPCTTPNGVATTTNGSSNSSNGSGAVAVGVSSVGSLPTPTPTSTTSSNYTSALMRNQRPPNVNVGPDGLNISQPRAHPGHPGHMAHLHGHGEGWQRPLVQPGQMTGSGGMSSMGQSAIMPPSYSHRPSSAGSVGGMGNGTMGGHGMMGGMGVSGGTQVMMHQSMQISQQHGMAMRGAGGGGMTGSHPQAALPSHSAPYNTMMGPGTMQTQANGGPAPQYPSGLPQDDFMQYFNSEQSHNFDSLSSDLFDDILK